VLGDRVMLFATTVEGDPDRAILVEAQIQNRIDALYDADSGQATSIVTQSGDVVIRGRNASTAAAPFEPETSLAAEAATTGNTTYAVGDDYVYAYAAVSFDGDDRIQEGETPKLVAVTTVPKGQAFALRSSVTTGLVTIVAVALLALGGFGAVIGYQTIRPLSKLRGRAERMEKGDLDVDLETAREDEIGRLYGSFAAMRDSLKERIVEAESAREEAERSRERVEELNAHLERKAGEYSDVMRDCAEGDLTRRMDAEGEHESMTEIAEAFNAMLDDIEDTVATVTRFSTSVATESEEVTASAEEVRNASQQVTQSIQEISDGAADQDRRLQAVSNEMGSLSTTTEEIASSSNEVASIAERTAETGRRGREAAEDAAEGMAEIRERSAAIVETVEGLESEMEGVDELTEFIAGVAKETNMLALNANIEASRAGSGEGDEEGFGVVAQQIKELAEDTQEATTEIENRLEGIGDRVETTVEQARESDAAIAENAESIENAIEALEDVGEYAQETNEGIQEISAATEEQASSVEEAVAMVDEVATISQRTAEEAETVASAAEEQTAAMNDVSESANDLASQAAELSDALDRFTVDPAADRGPGDPFVAPPEDPRDAEDD
jgi:methyl-accepting chemotaxis protein